MKDDVEKFVQNYISSRGGDTPMNNAILKELSGMVTAAIAKERERIKDILSRSLTDGEKYKLIDEGG